MSTTESSTATTGLPAGTWKVDRVHSSVEFHVKHLGIATVKGQFTDFEGTLEVGSDQTRAYGNAKVASVDTRDPQRDGHLRSPDFFDAEQFPQITFQSTDIRPSGDDEFEIDGDLSIHGVTNKVTFKATLEGTETDFEGHDRVGLSAQAQISRGDFGMKFNMALGSGNVVVADKVKIIIEISAVKA